jgi:hypothetical protein
MFFETVYFSIFDSTTHATCDLLRLLGMTADPLFLYDSVLVRHGGNLVLSFFHGGPSYSATTEWGFFFKMY